MKNTATVTTSSGEQTLRLGELIAKALGAGTVVALRGGLGAGKTVIAKGMALGIGVRQNITSPTFVIMNRYEPDSPDAAPLYHFDLYRNPSEAEFDELGFSEILCGDGFCVVEWAENLPAGFIADAVKISIDPSKENENMREITISAPAERFAVIKKEVEKQFALKRN